MNNPQRHNAARAGNLALAAAVRAACVQAAIEKFEDARMAGLCCEGALEAAIDFMRHIDLECIVDAAEQHTTAGLRNNVRQPDRR